MCRKTVSIMALGLAMVLSGSATAQVMPGTWDTMGSDLLTGTWVETYGPGGPGQPGCELSAQADDTMQWSLGGVFILAPASGQDNGDGTITYTTDYGNMSDPGASALMLGAAPTLWGGAGEFTNLMLTVQATIDMADGSYVGGTFVGVADAAGLSISINGTLTRTGFLGEPEAPTGHEGIVDYLAVTIERIPIEAYVDIKPGSCPNPLNRKSRGKLPAAILGTADFDVSMIDITTIYLSRADGIGGTVMPLMGPPGPHITMCDVGTPFDGEPCECHEMEGDGFDDLELKFSTPSVVEMLELGDLEIGATVELMISATLMDGTPVYGSDCVRLVGRDAESRRGKASRNLGQ